MVGFGFRVVQSLYWRGLTADAAALVCMRRLPAKEFSMEFGMSVGFSTSRSVGAGGEGKLSWSPCGCQLRKMVPKWYQNGPKMVRKWSQMGSPRRLGEEILTRALRTANSSERPARFLPRKSPQSLPKGSQNGPQIEKKSIRKVMKKSMPIFRGLGIDF